MKYRRRHIPRLDRRGMTLVELMIGISIFAILMAAVMVFMTQARRSYNDTRDRVRFQQGLRAVSSMLTREIRSTGSDLKGIGFEEIPVADLESFECRADLNGDGDVLDSGPDETVRYTFDSGLGELTRNDGFNDMIILRDMTSVVFRYFDENGAELANVPLSAMDRERIRSVQVLLAGETDRGEPVDLTSRIALRNI